MSKNKKDAGYNHFAWLKTGWFLFFLGFVLYTTTINGAQGQDPDTKSFLELFAAINQMIMIFAAIRGAVRYFKQQKD